MSHEVDWLLLTIVIIYTIIGIFICLYAFIDFKRGVHALDYIIFYFGLLSITGIFQFSIPFLHNELSFLGLYEGTSSPLAYNPVRNLGLLSIIVLFVLAEHILNDEINKFRLSIIISALSIYTFVLLYYVVNEELIYVNDVFPFAQKTRLDEFAYDIIWFLSLIMVTFAFYKQYKNSVNSEYTNSIRLIFIALSIFTISYLYEWMEHFFPIADIDFVYFSIPVFVALAYVYTKNPHFAYYTPHDIHFLQITMDTGRLIYAADVKSGTMQKNFFLSFSITSINTLLTEVLMSNRRNIKMEKIKLNQGEIIFQTIDDVILSVYTDKSSRVLNRSMKYFIREFIKENNEILEQYRKRIFTNIIGNLDDLLRKCIPLLSSKVIEVKNVDYN